MENVDEKQQELDLEEKVEVVDDDEVVVAEAKTEDKPNQEEITPDQGIEALKKRLEEEKKAREEAEKRAYEAQQQAQRAQRDVQDGDYQLIVNAISQTKQNADVLKSGYAEAMSVGDYRKAADFQEAIALNANKLSTLENGKNALEAKLKQPVQPIQPNDPVEAFAARLTPLSANWVRNNPDVVRDPSKYQKMIEGHNWAISIGGHTPDTPAYFEAVETFIGLRKPAPIQEESNEEVVSVAAAPVQKRTSAPPVAPTSRVASNSSGRPNVVRLTAEQKEMASMMGMSPEDYAKNMVALKREGKLN